MATSAMSTKTLNPNANPWLEFLPHRIFHHSPSADVATFSLQTAMLPYYAAPATAVLPYFVSPATVAVVPYYAPPATVAYFPDFCPVTPVVVQPPEVFSGRRSSAVKKRRWWKTTVMIRNIPNQFSRHMLVDFLDQVCYDQNARFGFEPPRFAYDFVYLPFDFQRGYNLGYAFVNFTSPFAAGKMWPLLGGYKWGGFEDCYGVKCTSGKVCEINWATIQGKKNLVNHFKHSRFVCDNIEYLPVLFTPPRDGATSSISPTTVGTVCEGPSTNPLPRVSVRY